MVKILEKIKIKYNQSLISKNLKLKQKVKLLEQDKLNLVKERAELYDLINTQQEFSHQVDLKIRKIKTLLEKNDLVKELREVLK